MNNTDSDLMKPIYQYFDILSPDKMSIFRNDLYQLPLPKREGAWKKNSDLISALESHFPPMIVARNEIANKNGYKNYVEYSLEKTGIPTDSFSKFKNCIQNTIDICNQNITSINTDSNFFSDYNEPCYLCQVNFPNITISEILEKYTSSFPSIKNIKNKITFKKGDKAFTQYIETTQEYVIQYRSQLNQRHQLIDVIHELGHVTFMASQTTKGNNIFENEEEAIMIQMKFLSENYPDLYHAFFGEILMTLHIVLFEIEAYLNPIQDMSSLYAKIFNMVHSGQYQVSNQTYLIEENIVMRPLILLPYAVAYSEIINN